MLITLITTLAGLGFGLWDGEPALFAVLGFLAGRVIALELGLRRLRRELLPRAAPADAAPASRVPASADVRQPAEAVAKRPEPFSLDLDWMQDRTAPTRPEGRHGTPDAGPPTRVGASAGDTLPGAAWLQSLRDWLITGNLFVRVGILLVFFGVGFLINYAVDQQWLRFSLELRLAAVAVASLGLLALGWRLRAKRRDYGLLLQGAAIGILYLDVYGAFQLADVLPATAAFVLMALIGLSAAALAVVQNASSLAWFGFAGGFLAPIVASSANEDHVALFSYYAILNATILAVAWLRSWRALNLLGFVFTFGIAVIWGVLRYVPERFASTEPFLVLFFLFYVAIAVLYALRQPPRWRGYVDTTLIFGTPIVAFACQVELVRHLPHGIAWSAALAGGFYLALGGLLRRNAAEGLKLLAQAFVALGIIFLSVAIPFALAADTTAGVWALEGAGLIWIGSRQGRPWTRAFGLILQAGAAVALIAGMPYALPRPFMNSVYLGAAMLAIAAAFSAYWLDCADSGRRSWERGSAAWLLIWGLAWWLGAGAAELVRLDAGAALAANALWYGLLTLAVAEVTASLAPWPRLYPAQAALPLLGLAALAASLGRVAHPAMAGGIAAWPVWLAAGYLVLLRMERREIRPYLGWTHAALALLLTAVLEWELVWTVMKQPALAEGWHRAAVALVPVLGLWTLTRLRVWPVTSWAFAYQVGVGGVLVFGLLLWTLWSMESPGGSAPLPWLPLLNPLDGMLALILLTLWHWWQDLGRRQLIHPTPAEARFARTLFGTLAFLWANLALLRALHQLVSIPYEWSALFRSDLVQTSVAVLWGLVGVGLLLLARARGSRTVWIAGATVLAAVVVKLFAVDLAASGTLERVISFLAVGGLLVGIGWWSPPPRADAIKGQATDRA
ncbi:DUF2339 domain-containing protein [Thiocystis violacea]|uniref:DUF2339 domain-containing protein n=1 Tax=Thiocystis violacea TaxID=13725 RepID=UPI0019049F6B|nr:DUF2339 domain-containing protein [Thiocystis violacea]MBK1721113.1 hypothetical protein [Thiocystis violacea]